MARRINIGRRDQQRRFDREIGLSRSQMCDQRTAKAVATKTGRTDRLVSPDA
jgi:hypothetical protein